MIDSKLQAELRAKFNPDGSELRKLQLRMLDILKYIDGVCKEHDITYWLSSGTCLGAVRHGGFIPWDDDVDIEMLRPDYEKFLKVWKNTEKYAIQHKDSDASYFMGFAKVRELNTRFEEPAPISKLYRYKGIFVDIFCMEPIGRLPAKGFDWFGRHLIDMYTNKPDSRLRSFIYGAGKKLMYFASDMLRPIMKLMYKRTVCHTFGSFNYGKLRKKEDLLPVVKLDFEGYSFPVPRNYESYLKSLFGDYETIPTTDSSQFHIHNTGFRL